MTDKQRKCLYFPLWRRAFDANWTVGDGGVARPRPDRAPSEELDAIEDMAIRIARQRGADSPTGPEDYRHAANFVATAHLRQKLGGSAAKVRPKLSSTQFTTQETTHFAKLAKLLAGTATLADVMAWNNPLLAEVDRLRAAIRAFNPAYVSALARGPRFGGCLNWEKLEYDQLKQLLLTLQNRDGAKRPNAAGPSKGQPYPKLEYVKKGNV
jgi:hypothetical protein